MSIDTNLDKIKDYLVNNREHILNIIKPFSEQKEQLISQHESILKPLIIDQYKFICKRLIADDLAKNGQFTPEEALYASEILDLFHFLEYNTIEGTYVGISKEIDK